MASTHEISYTKHAVLCGSVVFPCCRLLCVCRFIATHDGKCNQIRRCAVFSSISTTAFYHTYAQPFSKTWCPPSSVVCSPVPDRCHTKNLCVRCRRSVCCSPSDPDPSSFANDQERRVEIFRVIWFLLATHTTTHISWCVPTLDHPRNNQTNKPAICRLFPRGVRLGSAVVLPFRRCCVETRLRKLYKHQLFQGTRKKKLRLAFSAQSVSSPWKPLFRSALLGLELSCGASAPHGHCTVVNGHRLLACGRCCGCTQYSSTYVSPGLGGGVLCCDCHPRFHVASNALVTRMTQASRR